MTDVWMLESPKKTRVTVVISGDEKSGFLYCVHSAEPELFESKSLNQRLKRPEVEKLFSEDAELISMEKRTFGEIMRWRWCRGPACTLLLTSLLSFAQHIVRERSIVSS